LFSGVSFENWLESWRSFSVMDQNSGKTDWKLEEIPQKRSSQISFLIDVRRPAGFLAPLLRCSFTALGAPFLAVAVAGCTI
jgi:hypothetical protein